MKCFYLKELFEQRTAQLSSFIHGPLMANFADTRKRNVEGKKLSTIYMYY